MVTMAREEIYNRQKKVEIVSFPRLLPLSVHLYIYIYNQSPSMAPRTSLGAKSNQRWLLLCITSQLQGWRA